MLERASRKRTKNLIKRSVFSFIIIHEEFSIVSKIFEMLEAFVHPQIYKSIFNILKWRLWKTISHACTIGPGRVGVLICGGQSTSMEYITFCHASFYI